MNAHTTTPHRDWVQSAVQQYEGRLLRYAAQITHDVDRARDVVQDTFLALCRENPDVVEGHLAEWLYTVCRNRALDVQRKEKRMQTITAEQTAAQASQEAGQAAVAERNDSAAQILRLVERLSANQREVVRLKFQNGLSYKEISRITELSVTNVGYLIHTAIQKLRQQVEL